MSPLRTRKGRPGKATPKSAPTKALTRNSYPKEPLPANGETVIKIDFGPFGDGFEVTVRPAPAGDSLDAHFPSHKEARGWAGGLRLCHGWRIIDLAGHAA